jgi:Transcriptional regulators
MDIKEDLFLSQQALVTLFSVTNKLQTQGDKYLIDLTIRQMLAVPAIIHPLDGKATISNVARYVGTSKQNAKQIIDALGKKNYVSTEPNGQDKRAVNITITPEGRQAFSTCSERTDVLLADIFHDFTTEEIKTLWTLLKKLYRFDGIEQDGIEEHMSHNTNETHDILQHHKNYVKRRTTTYE